MSTTTTAPPRVAELPVVIESDRWEDRDPLDLLRRVDEALPTVNPATSVEDVANELRRETILMAGTWAETTGSCDGLQLQRGASGTCTVAYAGVPVRWNVTVGPAPPPPVVLPGMEPWLEYQLTPQSLVLTPDGVYGNAWQQFGADTPEELRCDRIPDVHVIPRREPTTFRYGRSGYDTGLNCAARCLGRPPGEEWDWLPIYITDDGSYSARLDDDIYVC